MKFLLVLSTLVSFTLCASILQNLLEELPIQLTKFQPKLTFKDELLDLHKTVVEIDSVTGNELEIGQFLEKYLTSKGFTVETQEVEPERYNIYAYFGESKNAKVLLTTHIDTVPPYFPYSRDGDKISGRGSVDAKASLVTQILSAFELFENGEIQEGDVALLFVVGEEYNGAGMRFANAHLNATWDHVIFGEPTEGKLGIGHKGVYHFDLNITGKASHSGYPELGIDANKKLIDTLYKIIHADYPVDELLGNTTVNPGLIDGGVSGNVVSPIAKAKILIRVANDAQKVKQIIDEIIQDENEEYHNIKVIQQQLNEPEYLNFTVPGFESTVLAYFTDVPNIQRNFKSRYLYGPGTIHVAHSANEFITVGELRDAIVGYKNLTKYLLHN